MVTCAGCGEENPDRARFCLGCGGPLVQPVALREVRKTVSVLFCDLVGSTELGERLDPEVLRAVLDRYFAVLREAVQRHGGIVEKFIGDAVMAVFGIPVLHEDDALRAVRGAAEIPPAVAELNEELERRWAVRLGVRLGVTTGEVVAGSAAGSGGQRLATGDAVNLAARLQALAAGGEVILGEATFRLVRFAVHAEPLEPVVVKGKAGLVRSYRLLAVNPPSSDLSVSSPLTGRGRELEQLSRAWSDTVTEGRPHRRTVLGMAGVGKSRLLAEFLTGPLDGAAVLRGRCLSYGQGITFWPVREIVGQAASWGEDDDAARALAKLADLMPERPGAEVIAERVGQLLGLAPVSAGLPESFWALAQLLEELTRWTPIVVVIDDLHWAEPTLLDLLDHLATAVAGPLLLLSAARPELLDSHPEWAGGAGERLVLDPLPEHEAAKLLDALLAPGRPPSAVREHVLAAAEGNPLFVEQLVGMLLEDGLLRRREGTWELTRELRPEILPGSISTLLSARLDRLPLEERREIEAGAVVGRIFWRGAVAELARDVVGPRAGTHLVDLVRRRLILREPSSFPADETFKFQHVLIRDAAYAGMPKADRATAHERFADWLEAAAGERAAEYDEILGYHLEQAVRLRAEIGAGDDAVDRQLALRAGYRLAAAGERAYERADVTTTVGLLSRSVLLLSDDPPARLDVAIDLSTALHHAGRLADAQAMAIDTMGQAAALGDRSREMRARLVQVNLRSWTDSTWDATEAEPILREAVSVFTAVDEDRGLAEAWAVIGRLRLDAGRARAAEDALERALYYGRRCGHARAVSQPTIWLLLALDAGPTPIEVAVERVGRIAGESGGDLEIQGEVLRTSAVLAARRRDFDRACQLNDQAARLFLELGMTTVAGAACAQAEFEIARCKGELPASESALLAAGRCLEEAGEKAARSSILAMLAHAQCARGNLDAARHSAELAAGMTQQGDLLSEVLWRTASAKISARLGDFGVAGPVAREAVALAAASDWLCLRGDALLDLAEVRQRAGNHAATRAAAQAALGLYVRKGDLASSDRARAVLRTLEHPAAAVHAGGGEK